MKYNELPKWAQKEVKETVTRWYIKNGEAEYGRRHLSECVKEYISEHVFEIEYDEFGENPVVEW